MYAGSYTMGASASMDKLDKQKDSQNPNANKEKSPQGGNNSAMEKKKDQNIEFKELMKHIQK